MNDKKMADFLLKLRSRNEMPINEDEYYLLGDIAERLIELSEQDKQERLEQGFTINQEDNPCLDCEVLLAEKGKYICPYCEKRKAFYEKAND